MIIIIRELKDSGRKVVIPVIPEEVSFQSGGTRFITYNILDKGEVMIPNGENLRRVRWESIFPGKNHYLPHRSPWDPGWEPEQYQSILSEWEKYGTPLKLLITGTPIYHDMYLYNYDIKYKGAFGDYHYTIDFVDSLDIVVTSTSIEQPKSTQTGGTGTSKTYTVVSGDNLWKIAQSKLGNGARHPEIYNLNKDAIESAAKKHGYKSSNNGWWIFPGTTLHIPA